MNRNTCQPGRHGQTLIFLLMVLVALFFTALWHFDLHKILYVKTLSQNAGDAAALAAARWQGRTLNLIGDLNIIQAMALMSEDTDTAESIAGLQARLCYSGPMIAAMAAQQAAKHNRIYTNLQFTAYLQDHANTVRNVYPTLFSNTGQMLFPEPFENAWTEYADMLDMLCDHGIAAAPDNMQLYNDLTGGHLLLNPDFYDAVNGQNWCWFYLNQPDLLDDYSNYQWWPPLPDLLPVPEPMNSEIFGLGLRRWTVIDTLEAVAAMEDLRVERDLGATGIDSNIMVFPVTWYAYAPSVWSEWSIFAPDSGFPVVGPVVPEYDVAGADAAIRIEAQVETTRFLSMDPPLPSSDEASPPVVQTDNVIWTAAAKPLGTLDGDRVDRHGLVLPAFEDVRLIPVDASSAPAGGAFNLAWRDHIENHLPLYELNGPSALSGSCPYCQALITWEDPTFRQSGIDWLGDNSDTCYTLGGPGGPSSSGGTRRAH